MVSRAAQSSQGSAILFDTVYGVMHNGAALTAATEFAFLANFTFTVLRPGSLVEIVTRGGGQVQLVGVGVISSRGYLDSAGPNTLYYLGGQRIMVANEFANPFTGFSGLWIPSLAVGAHTFKFNLIGEQNGAVYQRANGYESFAVQVIEHFNRGFF